MGPGHLEDHESDEEAIGTSIRIEYENSLIAFESQSTALGRVTTYRDERQLIRVENNTDYRTIVTGTGARRATVSATLPIRIRLVPVRPWLPITI